MTAYTLFSQEATGSSLDSDPTAYTMGVQFAVSQACTLTAMWFYSAPGATVLPQVIALFAVSGGTLVHSESASWSGAAGSGWVRAPFASPPSLTASTNYAGAVLQDTGTNWYSGSSEWWGTGPGSGGISNGPLSAPSSAASVNGQGVFNASATLGFPATTFGAANYWVDPEVTPSGSAHTATAALTVTPSFSAARVRGKYRAGALTVTPAFSAARTRGKYRTAALAVVPVFSAARTPGRYRTGALTVVPSFSAARTRGKYRTAALLVTPSFSAVTVHGHFRHAALTVVPAFTVTWTGGAMQTGVVFTFGDARWAWTAGSARNQ